MKRPFAVIGFSYLAALTFALYCGASVAMILAISCLALFIISLLFKNIRKAIAIPAALLTVAVAMAVYSFSFFNTVKPIEALSEKDAIISGTICDLPYKNYGKYYYTIKTDSVKIDGMPDVPQNIKLRMSLSKALDADVYDKFSGKVHFFTKEDDGTFSSKNTYAAKGIYIFAYLYEYEDYSESDGDSRPIYYYCLKCQQKLNSAIRMILPENYWQIASGILLGDAHSIDENVKNDFRDAGVSHLLSVSGLHMSIIAKFFVMLFLFFKLPKKSAYIFSCIGVILFMGITGFTPPVMRSGVMVILYFIALLLKTEADSLNSLGIAILIMSATNPFAGGDIALLLSFSATLGIILWADKLEIFIKAKVDRCRYGKKLLRCISSPVAVTLSATFFTLPLIMLCFRKISLVSVISNILVIFPSMIMLILMLVAAVLYVLGPLKSLAMLLGLVSGLLINFITFCVNVLARFPFATVSTDRLFMLFWLAGTVLLLAVAMFLQKGTRLIKISLILSSILLFTGILSYQIINCDITTLTVVDSGDGCSLVLSKGDKAAVLSCGGDVVRYNKLSRCLDSLNVDRLDYLVLSDFEDETAAFAQNTIDEYEPYYVILPERDDIDSKLSRAVSDGNKARYFTADANLELWKNVKIKINNSNAQSFLYITIDNINILVCPSGGNAEYIPKEYRKCGIFIDGRKVESLEKINAAYTIMSSSKNVTINTINYFADAKLAPAATAGDGSIAIDFLGNKNILIRRIH